MNSIESEKTLRRVLAISAFDGWSFVIVAGLSVLVSLVFSSWLGVGIGGMILAAGLVELAGRRRLMRGDASGIGLMACAQVIVSTTISAYALRNLLTFDETTVSAALSPEIRELIAQYGLSFSEIQMMIAPLYRATYGAVMALTVLFQGGLALYYLSRRKRVAEALETRRAEPMPPRLPDRSG